MLFLSFDCAHKTFAYVQGEHQIPDVFNLSDYNVIDLLDGRDFSEIDSPDRIRALKQVLDKITVTSDTIIFVEYQMGLNNKSNEIFSAILMYYAENTIHVVKPSLKNTVSFTPQLAIQEFYKKNAGSAIKKHTAANFNYLLEQNNLTSKLKPALINHVGDALMQVYGFVNKYPEKFMKSLQ